MLSWQDNLTEEDMPPEWMWTLDEELIEHFERVKERREERYGTPSSSGDDGDVGLTKNEYARGRGR